MTTPSTNYTTYDQAYYYADLKRLPRLSQEQRQYLVTRLPTADNPTPIKHHLIESYLPFAKHLAIALCPKSRYHRLLPDFIGQANLTVVEVITRSDLTQIDHLSAYLAAWIRGELKDAISHDGLITINYDVRTRARDKGETNQVDALDHVLSLDEQMEWFQTDDLEEPRTMPLTPTEPAPARDPQQRAQIETWLSYLSPRAQAIFRLRYGLCDDNERRHSTKEIVRLLGIDRRVVLTTERDALTRLRALAEGKATLVQRKNGKPYILYPQAHNCSTITPEQQAVLLNTYRELEAQGRYVSGRALAQAARVSQALASTYLRERRSVTPQQAREHRRQVQLEQACIRLEAQGKPFGYAMLAREAQVGKPAATAFLKARRSQSYATA